MEYPCLQAGAMWAKILLLSRCLPTDVFSVFLEIMTAHPVLEGLVDIEK
jgi:hypothetical protein